VIRLLAPEFPGLGAARMCRILEVSRSLVYRKPPSKDRGGLLPEIEKLVSTFLGYGYRRVLRALRNAGLNAGEHTVRRLMRENGLCLRKRSKGCTKPGREKLDLDNLLKKFKPGGPGKVWVADTTLVRTSSGAVYLAAVMDLFTRRIVAWHLSRSNDSDLALACLGKALASRRLEEGWIHHSDRGSTYTSEAYRSLIRASGGRQSLSAPGRPRDNAAMESFFKTLKAEEVGYCRYESFLELEASMERYIGTLYNGQRMHSSLGYLSPDQFEAQLDGGRG